MKNLKLLLALAFIAQIFTSCNSSLTFTKRHYNPGYYIDLNLASTKRSINAEPKSTKNGNETVAKMETIKAKNVSTPVSYDKTLQASADKNLVSEKVSLSKLHHKGVATGKTARNIFVKLGLSKTAASIFADDEMSISEKTIKELTAAPYGGGGKSWTVALLLVIFLGGLGIHRFYLGYTWQGIVQLLTLGGCGIWALIDLIRIITRDLKPKNGNYTD